MDTVIYRQGKRYSERQFKSETDFENLVMKNSKTLFGQHSIYIDAKKKIDNLSLGDTIPDGFLFDLSDIMNPEFYIVEVELAKHPFYKHIFPQVTKYFAFFKNADSHNKLIEKLYKIFEEDERLRGELKLRIGKGEIFKFLKDTIGNSQNILMIIDSNKQELPEIIETYTDTWAKIVKVAILKEYFEKNTVDESILTLTPAFENIEDEDIILHDKEAKGKAIFYTVLYHLEGVNEKIRRLYNEIETELLKHIEGITFNPQRYYISLRKKRNFAFLKIRQKKIAIVAMLEENKIRERIKHYNVAKLAEGVQKFYNGPCARIDLTDDKYLGEVIDLLIEIQK
jgi:predicted transport protein